MSVKAIAWAFEQELNPTNKLVLLSLANFANDKNLAWPSVQTVMKHTCLKRRAIYYALRDLEKMGLIFRGHRYRDSDGRQTSSAIRLNVSPLTAAARTCDTVLRRWHRSY